MQEFQSSIQIISNKQLRAKMIQDLIHHLFDSKINVSVLNSNNIDSIRNNSEKDIIIIDLASIDEPSGMMIKKIKHLSSDSKILAMHIYRSSMLIKPLYEMGIHGYLHDEPTEEELLFAIKTVHKGNRYIPKFL